jgi:hypothetical protein
MAERSSPLNLLLSLLGRARAWLRAHLATAQAPRSDLKASRRRTVAAFALIFLAALGVRLLHWRDMRVEILEGKGMHMELIRPYQREASRMMNYRLLLLPPQPFDRGDARLAVHPPGYSILMLALYGGEWSDSTYFLLRLVQVVCDSLSAALVFLIAARLLPLTAAITAGAMAALSPHLSYYSLWLSPESLAVLPILLAVYLVTLSIERARLWMIILGGALLGLSCWLRSDSLLLAPMLAAVIFFLVERGKRLRHAAALVAAMALVISPITIRNWIVYRQFAPVTIIKGLYLIEGIGAFDKEGRFGLTWDDREAARLDAAWHDRPDYAGSLWMPDGIERDRYRFARGLEVIRSNPGWFAGAMLSRAAFMLRYNDSEKAEWPFNTSRAPVIQAAPSFGHSLVAENEAAPAWSASPHDLLASGSVLAPQAEAFITEGPMAQILGDGSQYDHQFASETIAVRSHTDYVLTLPVELEQGMAAAKVTSADERITLASAIITRRDKSDKKRARQAEQEAQAESADDQASTDNRSARRIQLPFASDDKSEVRLVISNNGATAERTIVSIGDAELFERGPTPALWTRPARAIARGIQKNLFKTDLMRALIAAGVCLLALARRFRALAILLAVPVYYLVSHSPFSTEYRYVLGIHYFLFMMSAVALYSAAAAIGQAVKSAVGVVTLCLG